MHNINTSLIRGLSRVTRSWGKAIFKNIFFVYLVLHNTHNYPIWVFGTVFPLFSYVGVKQGCMICISLLYCIILIIIQFGAPAELSGAGG